MDIGLGEADKWTVRAREPETAPVWGRVQSDD